MKTTIDFLMVHLPMITVAAIGLLGLALLAQGIIRSEQRRKQRRRQERSIREYTRLRESLAAWNRHATPNRKEKP